MLNRNPLFGGRDSKFDDKRNSQAASSPAAPAPTPPEPSRLAPSIINERKPSESPLAPPPAAAADDAKGSRLIVGPNIKLKGVEVTDCDTLVVEGHVEATVSSRELQIATPGTFVGTVSIDVAEIHGKFTGDLTARGLLVIHATGSVSGKVRYGKLVVEEGGELNGEARNLAVSESVPLPPAAPPARPMLTESASALAGS